MNPLVSDNRSKRMILFHTTDIRSFSHHQSNSINNEGELEIRGSKVIREQSRLLFSPASRMASAPPAILDPAQTLPPRRSSRSLILDVSKVFVGALIALLLAAILAVLLFVPNQPGGVDLRQSNEEIARLQRDQQIQLEHERQKHVENITALHRADEQQMEQQRRELELFLLMEKLRRAESLEEKRFDLIKQEHQRTEYFEKEKLQRESEKVLAEIMQEIVSMKQPLDLSVVQWKILSGIRRLQSSQKSMLIPFLYKLNLLHGDGSTSTALDLQGTDLKDLNLNRIEPDDYDRK